MHALSVKRVRPQLRERKERVCVCVSLSPSPFPLSLSFSVPACVYVCERTSPSKQHASPVYNRELDVAHGINEFQEQAERKVMSGGIEEDAAMFIARRVWKEREVSTLCSTWWTSRGAELRSALSSGGYYEVTRLCNVGMLDVEEARGSNYSGVN